MRALRSDGVDLSGTETKNFVQLLPAIPKAVVHGSTIPAASPERISRPLPNFLHLQWLLVFILLWLWSERLADSVPFRSLVARWWWELGPSSASEGTLHLEALLLQLIHSDAPASASSGEKQGFASRADNHLRSPLVAAPAAVADASADAPSRGSGTDLAALGVADASCPVGAAARGSKTTPGPYLLAACGNFSSPRPMSNAIATGGTPSETGSLRCGSARPHR
ncbi:hypothetical protein KR200_006334 [Drosophila serrata]|nr:hypothetical protein KR200_006334 [Drosophila serrata]